MIEQNENSVAENNFIGMEEEKENENVINKKLERKMMFSC